MSTKIDTNYRSYSGADGSIWQVTGEHLDPIADGWASGSWSDTLKVHQCTGWEFRSIYVVGGKEDCVDGANRNRNNLFNDFECSPRGKYVLTWKGGSTNNQFNDWVLLRHAKVADIEIGNWAHVDQGNPTGNVFRRWQVLDGTPVTYCYRFGCKPRFVDMKTKHLWWRSIGLTAYWWVKFAAFKLSGGKLK
jgi:hypothetical protein